MNTTRQYWIDMAVKVSKPVLESASKRQLSEKMPYGRFDSERHYYRNLEAVGRTLCGIAPWFEVKEQDAQNQKVKEELIKMARASIDAITDPDSPDYAAFTLEQTKQKRPVGCQPVVDSAFLAYAILRAPNELWVNLDDKVKNNVIKAFRTVSKIRSFRSNWLLFSAMTQTALRFMTGECDMMHIDYGLYQFERWYKGDGTYGDGEHFSWDYYNSFVIQPFLVDIILKVKDEYYDISKWANQYEENAINHLKRYSVVLERLIHQDGSFAPIGRSLSYRCGAFHALAYTAFKEMLPEKITPQQVRCALTAVIKKTLEAKGTFDENGWLTLGLCGFQPSIAEPYISTGSLYLCTFAFLPLGLDENNIFWKGEDELFTSQKIWSGIDVHYDHAEH